MRRTEISALYEELLKNDISLRTQVTGNSMKPVIRSGDRIILRQTPANKLRLGDILALKTNDGTFLVHRLLRKTSTVGDLLFHTRGDALGVFDLPVREEHILGKVIGIEKTFFGRAKYTVNMESLPVRCLNAFLVQYFLLRVLLSQIRQRLRGDQRSKISEYS